MLKGPNLLEMFMPSEETNKTVDVELTKLALGKHMTP